MHILFVVAFFAVAAKSFFDHFVAGQFGHVIPDVQPRKGRR